MRLHGLSAAFIFILSAFAILIAVGPTEPSPRIVLLMTILVICYLVYLTHPIFEEKWNERKQRGRAPREQSRQGIRESPIAAGPANLQEREAPSLGTSLNGEVGDTLSFPAPEGKLQALPSPRAPANTQASTGSTPSIASNTDRAASDSVSDQPVQEPKEPEPPSFSECIRTVLSKLEEVSSYAELLPYVEMLYEQMPEQVQPEFPKLPRTLSEHLYITRAFNKAATTEEKFSERTDDGVAEKNRTYPSKISVAQLQDCKREWRWLVNYLCEIDAAKKPKRKKPRK